jgi:hypothetical protein
MSLLHAGLTRLPSALLCVVLIGCSRDRPAGGNDTATPSPSPPVDSPSRVTVLAAVWDTAAGPFFVIAGPSPGEGLFIDPSYSASQRLDTLRVDPAAVADTELDLLSPADSVRMARVAAVTADSATGCANWARVRLVGTDGRPPSLPWAVGFPRGRVKGVAFDSLPALPPADSARLTMMVARASSRAPGDSAAAFRGRPYVVRQANRFHLADGRQLVFAEVVRVVNQEANPLQEELMLVVETEPGSRDDVVIAYSDRQIGLEEAVESVALLSAFRLRDGTWSLLVQRELRDGARLVLLERSSPGRWVVRWRSAFSGC